MVQILTHLMRPVSRLLWQEVLLLVLLLVLKLILL
jgi:hypothetical protein